jgi:hypothetical protein
MLRFNLRKAEPGHDFLQVAAALINRASPTGAPKRPVLPLLSCQFSR